MRVPREVWWIAGLTLVVIALATALHAKPQGTEKQGMPNRTTYSAAPYGLKALYLTLTELGYETKRLRTPLTKAGLPEHGILWVVDPMPLTEGEWEDVRRWVEAGNALILAGGLALPNLEGALEAMQGWFEEAPLTYARATQPSYLVAGVRVVALRSEVRIKPFDAGPGAKATRDDEKEIEFGGWSGRSEALDRALSQAAPVMADKKGAVVAQARPGKGRVVLLASSWMLSNEAIAEADNLLLALNAAGAPDAGAVYFDEYHHGYRDALSWTLLPLAVKLALAQTVLGLLLVVYARSRRLGPVVPLDRGGRQRSEFLGTMTTVLRKGHATRLAVSTAYEAARQRLGAQTGLSQEVDDSVLAEAASRGNPGAVERLAAALAAARGALGAEGKLAEARAAALIRQLDDAMAEARRI